MKQFSHFEPDWWSMTWAGASHINKFWFLGTISRNRSSPWKSWHMVNSQCKQVIPKAHTNVHTLWKANICLSHGLALYFLHATHITTYNLVFTILLLHSAAKSSPMFILATMSNIASSNLAAGVFRKSRDPTRRWNVGRFETWIYLSVWRESDEHLEWINSIGQFKESTQSTYMPPVIFDRKPICIDGVIFLVGNHTRKTNHNYRSRWINI